MVAWLTRGQTLRLIKSRKIEEFHLDDNEKIYFGDNDEGYIYFDGTDLIVKTDSGDITLDPFVQLNVTKDIVMTGATPSITGTATDATISSAAGDVYLSPGGGDVFNSGNLTFTGTSPNYIYGGDTTGTDFYMYSNNVDAAPYMRLEGNASIWGIAATDVIFQLGDAAGANVFRVRDSASVDQVTVNSDGVVTFATGGSIVPAATDTTIYGGDATGNDLSLRANSVDSLPEVVLNGNAGATLKGATHVNAVLGDAAGANKFRVRDSTNTNVFLVDSNGDIELVNGAPISNATSDQILIGDTTHVPTMPTLTTVQRDALSAVNGMGPIYNSTTATAQMYINGAWTNI